MSINLTNRSKMVQRIILFLLIVVSISTIGFPLRMRQSKCMIVYTIGQSQTVKVQAKLPQIPDRLPEQSYQIVIKNTQTNEQVVERSLPGVYKRELSLTSNIIYQICFTVKTDRQYGRVIVQYTAQNLFMIDHSEIKVPDNLLKSGDFKASYQTAQKLHEVTKKFTQLQTTRKESQSQTFTKTNDINLKLIYISIGQLCIILIAGAYQFFTLRKYLAGKQYI